MYERSLLFRYMFNREFVPRARFVKSWYDAVVILSYSPYMTITNENVKDAETIPHVS